MHIPPDGTRASVCRSSRTGVGEFARSFDRRRCIAAATADQNKTDRFLVGSEGCEPVAVGRSCLTVDDA